MRKNVAKLLAAGLAASLMISGCGGSTAAGTEAPAQASSAASSEAAGKPESEENPAGRDITADGDNTASGNKPADGDNTASGNKPADGETPPEKPEDGSGKGRKKGGPGGNREGRPEGEHGGSGKGRPEGGPGEHGGPGGAPGQSASDIEYTAVYAPADNETITNGEYTSTGTDEEAILVDGDITVTVADTKVTRSSEDSTGGDSSSFYGVGAAILGKSGTAYLKNLTIDTDAKGGAGVFAYSDGVVYVADSVITTKKSTSGGIHAAGGGTLYAWNVTAETDGESSAAIRSDRGGGTMVVDGGSYTSNGNGSPAIYSTADIAVNNAVLTANGSEAICIEGLNSIHLFDSELTGNMKDQSQNDCTWNVILYQSMSGDSKVGNSTFEMNGGTLTAKNGGMFYSTNTESTFILKDVDITYAEDSEFFLKVTGNANQRGWGSTGANGADTLFTAISQEMEGNVIWDSISQLDLYMTEGSSLKGAFIDDESAAGDGGDGYANLYISADSTWTVTGDSVLTNLYNAGTIADDAGKTVTIQTADGKVLFEGTSEYTVTVESYTDKADLSGASAATSFSDYAAEKPQELQ